MQYAEFSSTKDTIMSELYWGNSYLSVITRIDFATTLQSSVWTVTSCTGIDARQQPVRVILPFSELPKGGLKSTLNQYLKDENIHGKSLKIFEVLTTVMLDA